MTADPQLVEYTERTKLWRCAECGLERPFAVLEKASQPAWCLGENGSHRAVPTPMSLVERERVFPSFAAWRLLTVFERSDWGLLINAVEHYKRNRQRGAQRNPGADAVLARGVYPRFDAMRRAFGELRRAAPGDTEHGGRAAAEWVECDGSAECRAVEHIEGCFAQKKLR
jgi:hypothetical protein